MKRISKYGDYLIEREFSKIVYEALALAEAQTGQNTFEWEFDGGVEKGNEEGLLGKVKQFVAKLKSKQQALDYFNRLVEQLKILPSKIRKSALAKIALIFLSVVSINELLPEKSIVSNPILAEIKMEIAGDAEEKEAAKETKKEDKKSSFSVAQKLVSIEEAGYSDDKDDTGNWIEFKMGNKQIKRFIGTKYGISAPVLKTHLGRIPKKEDMVNLKYKTALEIYKKKYWTPQNLGYLDNQSIANVIYDGCVNQGIEGMKKVLRQAMNEKGIKIGESENPFDRKHIDLINKSNDKSGLFNAIKDHRENRYKTAETFDKHGEGWLNRLDRIEYKNIA